MTIIPFNYGGAFDAPIAQQAAPSLDNLNSIAQSLANSASNIVSGGGTGVIDFGAELRAQLDNQMKIAQGGWAVQKAGIKAQLKIAKKQLQFQYDQMRQIGIPTMEANIWYQQQQIRLADQANSLAQSNLGLEYMKFASTLRGPENYFQSSDFARGASQRQDVPVFMQNLLKNMAAGNNAFGASGGTPDPVTAQSMMAKLTGSGPNSQSQGQDSAALNSMDQIFKAGAHRLSPGTLESLDQSELALLSSAGDKLGYDVPRWMRDYANSRVGTEAPNLA